MSYKTLLVKRFIKNLDLTHWNQRDAIDVSVECLKAKAPSYLINFILKCERTIRTRNNHISTCTCRTDCFKSSFFPSVLNDLLNLDIIIRKSKSISVFKSKLLSFISPVQSNICSIFELQELKIRTRLLLDLSHLNEHRSLNNFQGYMNPLCSWSLEIEDTSHYLPHYYHFSDQSLSDSCKKDVL